MHAISKSPAVAPLAAKPAAPPSRLEQLYKIMGELRKQLRSLYKELEDAGSPAERMALREQITAREEMIETIRREIVFITQSEERNRLRKLQHVSLASAVEDTPAADEARAAGGLYKPPYQLADR